MDSSNRESLPVSYIRQFCFCPRIPFLSVFLEIKPPSPLWVQDGVDFHEKAAMLQKRRKLSKFNLSGKGVFKSNIYLKSSVYPIHGIADGIFIMEDGEIIPLEFKAQDNFVASRGHILQLTGYAILLEEKFQREVKQGFILYGKKGKSLRVEFTEERKKKVIEIAQKIISSFETGLLPDSPAASAQCGQCEFLNFCGDRF